MPLVQIAVRAGRPPENLRRMISAVTAAVAESLDAPKESIRVIVSEVPTTHWATGDVTLAEKSAASGAAGQPTEPAPVGP